MVLDPGAGLRLLAPLALGVLAALVLTPLYRALATRRRQALLVDRVVTGRVAQLGGTDRRRAVRHLHHEAGNPVPVVLGLAAAAGAVTLVAAVLVARLAVGASDRRALIDRLMDVLDDAGFPTPGAGSAVLVVAVVVSVLLALAIATLHVATLDVERRLAMPVTRPWPFSKRRTTWLVAAVVFLLLFLIGLENGALAAGLFLLGHQLTVRAMRPRLCAVAPVLPEALRAARLPGPKERRLIRSRRGPAPGPGATGPAPARPPAGPDRAVAAAGGPRSGPGRTPPPRPTAAPRPPTTATRLIDMAPPEQPLTPHDPRTVGEYQLTGRLGSGGMGTVYLGHRAGTAGQVAIKVLAPHLLDDVDARTRFLREGQTLQKVTGDYTARVHGVGFDGSMPYIVMERLDGPSLHTYVCESGAVRDAETLTRMSIALARALAALHNDGITHRDLKPGNILLTSAGPKVVDFGIARVVGQTHHTPAGNMVGTPGYMAPEQVTGNGAGPATDVWAWACCVVFAARGDHLFDGENIVDIARRILDGPPADAFAGVGRLSPRLVPVLRRATAQDAADRPRDGAALLRLLDRSGATATVGAFAWDKLVGAR
ncbi:serine/threonine-protein kinase [Actinomycetospora termitidis]|uniref:Serine/threonine-protein kinase n=1 Tax=Actinomycetospora termitidis TaxID=3053470 RepID=A0ABT7M1R3_9PSEU|nr:serine/threonine-protein kinase [Actinomycetospora sp. Odt1-22]MDL5154597.1 serine/threonine-protein kinase [Actinomycetospora sp. Odt1-22]